ncbi:hypothetical protein RAH57_13960 [Chryseobacterium sp. CKR4-1]|uniref:hypothetical protein n=1 Tax=Chryseobacterium sp. CKR4-1 TaxID=3068896 RepID=UPI002796A0A4|nr:hypothetical protein [Chryseobacterium sp. CKR4-1]MDQ1805098.1 hypothetical protein [Chryseobacterium sp. CKR4-1]
MSLELIVNSVLVVKSDRTLVITTILKNNFDQQIDFGKSKFLLIDRVEIPVTTYKESYLDNYYYKMFIFALDSLEQNILFKLLDIKKGKEIQMLSHS